MLGNSATDACVLALGVHRHSEFLSHSFSPPPGRSMFPCVTLTAQTALCEPTVLPPQRCALPYLTVPMHLAVGLLRLCRPCAAPLLYPQCPHATIAVVRSISVLLMARRDRSICMVVGTVRVVGLSPD